MQLIQPKVQELQKKYGHDREKLAQETMELYKDSGTNPFASCLPILLQMPIFLALFRHARPGAKNPEPSAASSTPDAQQAVPRRGLRRRQDLRHVPQHRRRRVRILAAVLVIAMTATTFLTQRQLMSKNMPADALSGPYAQQQKMLLYVLPVVFAVGGIAFPVGVLFYWTTSNLWTMGQQFYVIRNNPAPGTPAAKAKEERDRRRPQGVPAGEVAASRDAGVGDGSRRAAPARSRPQAADQGRSAASKTRRRSADPTSSRVAVRGTASRVKQEIPRE